jgi:hypothetical protein
MKYTLVGRNLKSKDLITLDFKSYTEVKLEQFVMEDMPEYSDYIFTIQICEQVINTLLSSLTELPVITH